MNSFLLNKCILSLITLPSPGRQKAMWESNHVKILYFNLMSTPFRNTNSVLGVRNQMSFMLSPIFCYLDSSRLFELAEQGVASFAAESVQTTSWMTRNDLGIVSYSLHSIFFMFISQPCKKLQHAAENSRLYMNVSEGVCFTDFRKTSYSKHSFQRLTYVDVWSAWRKNSLNFFCFISFCLSLAFPFSSR